MKRLIWLLLGTSVLGVASLAACPQAGLPVREVKAIGPGNYMLLIQNDRACPVATFKIVFEVEVAKVIALTLNGPAVLAVEGAGRVWTIKLAGPGLKPSPKAYLLVGVEGVIPPVEALCEELVRYVFPYPPFCL